MIESRRIPVVVSMDVCGSPELMRQLDGFQTVAQVVEKSGYPAEDVEEFLAEHLKAKRVVWRDEWTPLMWCGRCDLPLLQTRCGLCGEEAGRRIDLKFPCNPRPVLAHDEAMLRALGFPWPMDSSLLINAYKVPDHWGWELIHHGRVIGDVVQTHQSGAFRFIAREPFDRDSLADRGVTMDRVIAANAGRLDYLEKEALAFLNSYKQPFSIVIPVLGFSGGKDSVVLAHIVSKSKFARAYVYQIDTGIEEKSNEEFSRAFLARYRRFSVTTLHSGDIYWRAIERLGPQALDFQWCRKILKNLAIQRGGKQARIRLLELLSSFVKTKVLVLHGARNREEPERVPIARTLKLAANHALMPKAASETVFPLALFTDLDIWMYTHSRKLPVNPVYTRGKNQRLLCMFCFEKDDYEFENDIKEHPEVYARMEKALEGWRKKLGFPREWVSRRLWRYNDSGSRYMKDLGIGPRIEPVIAELKKAVTFEPESADSGTTLLKGRLNFGFRVPEIARWLRALGTCAVKDGALTLTPDRARILGPLGAAPSDRVSMELADSGEWAIMSNDLRLARGFREVVAGWAQVYGACIQCGGCLNQSKDIVLGDPIAVKRTLDLATVKAVFRDCPVHPEGVRNMARPLSKEYSPSSCTACFINYKKDMAYIDPSNADTTAEA